MSEKENMNESVSEEMNEVMNEFDADQENNSNEGNGVKEKEEKRFTQEEMERIVEKRLKKIIQKRNIEMSENAEDEEYKKARAEAYEESFKEAEKKCARLEAEIASYKEKERLRQIREDVSKRTGIPATFLAFDTEEECEEAATLINQLIEEKTSEAISNGYPYNGKRIRDCISYGGNISRVKTKEERFAEFVKSNTNTILEKHI